MVGFTRDIHLILKRGSKGTIGKVPSTRNRTPFVLVYHEIFDNKSDAIKRERYFKTPEGGMLKQRLIDNL